jgi:hypothetical protein
MGAMDSILVPSVIDKYQLPSHIHVQHPVHNIRFGYYLVRNRDLALLVLSSLGLLRVVA